MRDTIRGLQIREIVYTYMYNILTYVKHNSSVCAHIEILELLTTL